MLEPILYTLCRAKPNHKWKVLLCTNCEQCHHKSMQDSKTVCIKWAMNKIVKLGISACFMLIITLQFALSKCKKKFEPMGSYCIQIVWTSLTVPCTGCDRGVYHGLSLSMLSCLHIDKHIILIYGHTCACRCSIHARTNLFTKCQLIGSNRLLNFSWFAGLINIILSCKFFVYIFFHFKM